MRGIPCYNPESYANYMFEDIKYKFRDHSKSNYLTGKLDDSKIDRLYMMIPRCCANLVISAAEGDLNSLEICSILLQTESENIQNEFRFNSIGYIRLASELHFNAKILVEKLDEFNDQEIRKYLDLLLDYYH